MCCIALVEGGASPIWLRREGSDRAGLELQVIERRGWISSPFVRAEVPTSPCHKSISDDLRVLPSLLHVLDGT